MLYLDTSALLKLYILEEGSEQVDALVRGQSHPLPVWEIQEMEFTNGLWLKVFRKEISAVQAETQLKLFHRRKKTGSCFFPEIRRASLMDTFARLSRKSAETGCRTMDILHVACALEVGAATFVSFDNRQQRLAASEGLAVADGFR